MVTYNANLVVHIDESLSADQLHDVEQNLSGINGIVSACVHERTPHLMVVDYDPLTLRSQTVLKHFQGNGLHAELIGGI